MQRLDSFAEQFGLENDEGLEAAFASETAMDMQQSADGAASEQRGTADDGEKDGSASPVLMREMSSAGAGQRGAGARSPMGLPAVQAKLKEMEERLAVIEEQGGSRAQSPSNREGKLSLASVGSGAPLTISTPINPKDLRAELIEWVEAQLAELKSSLPDTAEAADSIAMATDKLREELKEWLQRQRIATGSASRSPSVGSAPSAGGQAGGGSRAVSPPKRGPAPDFSSPDSIAKAVAEAVESLKKEVSDWLEARYGEHATSEASEVFPSEGQPGDVREEAAAPRDGSKSFSSPGGFS
jgi:hypothetical protein